MGREKLQTWGGREEGPALTHHVASSTVTTSALGAAMNQHMKLLQAIDKMVDALRSRVESMGATQFMGALEEKSEVVENTFAVAEREAVVAQQQLETQIEQLNHVFETYKNTSGLSVSSRDFQAAS